MADNVISQKKTQDFGHICTFTLKEVQKATDLETFTFFGLLEDEIEEEEKIKEERYGVLGDPINHFISYSFYTAKILIKKFTQYMVGYDGDSHQPTHLATL